MHCVNWGRRAEKERARAPGASRFGAERSSRRDCASAMTPRDDGVTWRGSARGGRGSAREGAGKRAPLVTVAGATHGRSLRGHPTYFIMVNRANSVVRRLR